MALTFLVEWRLRGGVSKASYFSTVWQCILSSLAIWAFFRPFFERVWIESNSSAEGEVVHAQDPRSLTLRKPHRTDVVQQGIPGDHDPEVFQQT